MPSTATTTATTTAPTMAERALRLLDQYLICDVECNGIAVQLDPGDRRWYDTRPMLDRREHSPEWVDMAELAIAWGLQRGVLRPHAQQPHLVRCEPVPLP